MFLRPAEPEDALGVAHVHVRSWQAGYRNLLPDEYLDSLRPEERAAGYNFGTRDPLHPATIVAANGATIFGFAITAPARDPDLRGVGELLALYVDPDRWGQGIGAALVAAARARLLDLGFRSAALWMMDANQRAARFYAADGWSTDGARRTESVWGAVAEEIRYRRPLGSFTQA